MKLNDKKSNIMIFNNTKNYQFQTRLTMNGKPLPIVNEAKLLGTLITSDLKWDTSDLKDLKHIYITYVRSVLEQSAVVWHSSLTLANITDLERVQKNALRIILKDNYTSYNEALTKLNLEDLETRRVRLCKTICSELCQ